MFRNCIDATSQCFGCICEVLDFWWPKDAPNCYRKQIVTLMEDPIPDDQDATSDASTQTDEENLEETKIEPLNDVIIEAKNTQTDEDHFSFYGKSIFLASVIVLAVLFTLRF